ncbi:MAG TPA: sensor domain-containing diguanylate cyclase [Gaiellaceae bacterium]|nr:sensor domain-containing diguanylate cyclase [Gaiellaceae bacterium]
MARRFSMLPAPFFATGGMCLLTYGALAMHVAHTDVGALVAAIALSFELILASIMVPWSRLPAWAVVVLPVGCEGLIALLRQSQGGATSGFGVLVLLPVLWAALRLGRRSVAVLIACASAVFVVPMVAVGAPLYPSSGWRGAGLITVVAAIIGFVTVEMRRTLRGQMRAADRQAELLGRLVETQQVISSADFDFDTVLKAVAEESLRLTQADAAVVALPEEAELVFRAVAGAALPFDGMRLECASTIAGRAFETGETLVCDDSEQDKRVNLDACRLVGARAIVVVPLLHEGRTVGVLLVYAREPGAFGEQDVNILSLLGNLVATALVRAEVIQELNSRATTDELTGLLNRGAWYAQLGVALARSTRSGRPVSVIALDVDGLKRLNDSRGHSAGDELLTSMTQVWQDALRPSDVLGRIGGDEFAVILEGASESDARWIVARLALALGVGRSASAGVATWDELEPPEALVQRADDAMYRSKRARGAARAALHL